MCDFAGKLAGKTKCGRRRLDPAAHGVFRRSAVKCGVDLNGGKIARVKGKPVGLWQVRWIKGPAPLIETPRARTDANFLLIGQVQEMKR